MEMIVRGGPDGAPAESDPPAGQKDRFADTAAAAGELDRLVQALTGLVPGAAGASGASGARRALNDIAATGGPDGPPLAAAGESLAAAETAGQLQQTLRSAATGLGRGLAAVAALPLPMAQKEQVGMAMLRQARRLGLVGEDPAVPAFLASHLRLADGQRRLAGTRGEGEAAAVAAEFAADPALLPEDRVAIETLARQRGAVERHRRQGDLRARETEDLAAFAAGRVAPRLGEESFHRLYGPTEGARRWQAYAAAAEQGRATAAIRGLWAAPWLTEVHGADATQIGRVTLAMGLAMVAGSFAVGPAARLAGGARRAAP